MHITGSMFTCTLCGAPLWLEWEHLEPLSALWIALNACLRCGAAFISARRAQHVEPVGGEGDDHP